MLLPLRRRQIFVTRRQCTLTRQRPTPQLWSWFEPYLDDPEVFNIDGTPSTSTTMGAYVIRLLTDQDYFGDRLPRIPVPVQRSIDSQLKRTMDTKQTRPDTRGRPAGAAESSAAQAANEDRIYAERNIQRKRAEIAVLEERVRELRQRIGEKESELRSLRR